MTTLKTLVGVLVLCVFVGLGGSVVRGDLMNLTTVFSGTGPVGNQPWVEITFLQQTASSVKVTVDVPAQPVADPLQSEFLSQVYLNLDPSLNPSLISITQDSGIAFTSWAVSEDAYKADGDGSYDIDIEYPTANSGRLTTGTSSSFTITYDSSPLSVSSFDYKSTSGGGAGTCYAAAHVQGIPPGDASGWVGSPSGPSPVPEPSTFVLLLGGVSLIGFARLRRAI
jgi:hypothetical protein